MKFSPREVHEELVAWQALDEYEQRKVVAALKSIGVYDQAGDAAHVATRLLVKLADAAPKTAAQVCTSCGYLFMPGICPCKCGAMLTCSKCDERHIAWVATTAKRDAPCSCTCHGCR